MMVYWAESLLQETDRVEYTTVQRQKTEANLTFEAEYSTQSSCPVVPMLFRPIPGFETRRNEMTRSTKNLAIALALCHTSKKFAGQKRL